MIFYQVALKMVIYDYYNPMEESTTYMKQPKTFMKK